MTEYEREQVSALADGELDDSILDSLDRETVQDAWWRYHLIADAIHQRSPLCTDLNLSRRISAAIAAEPAILAPSRAARRPLPGFIRPAAGLAVAATVATVAILGVQQYQAERLGLPPETAQAVTAPAAPLPAREFSVPAPDRLAAAQTVAQPMVQPVQREIHTSAQISRYILNHNEYQSSMGVQGVTPYVRLVATGNNNDE